MKASEIELTPGDVWRSDDGRVAVVFGTRVEITGPVGKYSVNGNYGHADFRQLTGDWQRLVPEAEYELGEPVEWRELLTGENYIRVDQNGAMRQWTRNSTSPGPFTYYRDPRPLPKMPRAKTLEEKIADLLRYYGGFASRPESVESLANQIAALLESEASDG